jgi:F-type H+-transporting ATPase subunit gamma
MSNVKALRNRIKSVKSTQKITKAMRMVSAAKLHRAKDSAEFAGIYREKILSILNASKNSIDASELSLLTKSMMFESDDYKKTIIILYGSDRGLCGAYNSNILKKIRKEIKTFPNVKLLTIGKKIGELSEKLHHSEININISNNPSEVSKTVRDFILSELETEPSTQVLAYYTKFKNTLTQIPTALRLIPIEERNITEKVNLSIEFEGENLIEKLSELYIESNIVANLYESKASEEASRMTAMDNATRNAGDMIQKLTLKMNRTRQAQITKELIEVISGAEAV